MPEHIEHPRLADEALESRTYQEVIAVSAAEEDTLCVLPTGLGKTAVAIILAAQRLEQDPGSKVLVLAPTRPLVEQHRSSFERALDVGTGIFEVMTGDTRPAKREELWKEVGAFFATPQVVENDIISDRLDLSEFCLVVFDECHRASGEYPYTFIAEQYHGSRPDSRVLGLTASPGSDRDQIEQVAKNLGITNYEVRTEDDPDVRPYIQETDVNWVKVPLSQHFKRVKKHLSAAKNSRLKELRKQDLASGKMHKTDLLKLQGKLRKRIATEDDPALYQAISTCAGCLKVEHALELLETQGIGPLHSFLQKMKADPGSKAEKRLLEDEDFQNAMAVTEWMVRNEKQHPKLEKLQQLVSRKMTEGETAIVFSQYRDTVDTIVEELDEIGFIEPEPFKGQKDGGFTQQDQIEILDRFRDDDFNVLVSTSVAEEGLDIPAVDYVFFYEPVPSEIRSIQRRGRTGRQERGRIYVLMTENTRDEGYYWSAHNKEEKMKQVLDELKDLDAPSDVVANPDDDSQQTLQGFDDEEGEDPGDDDEDDDTITVIADDRENRILKGLARSDVGVESRRLEVADFVLSDRAAVERKGTADFVDSLLDGRLFDQMKELADQYARPMLILEGESLFGHRNVHENALRGALASLALDYDLPVLWSEDVEETVELLIACAKREQEDHERAVAIRDDTGPTSEHDLQAYVVAGLPNVSTTLAERLLEEFGDIRSVFTAAPEQLQTVEGIGEKKAARINEILTKEYSG